MPRSISSALARIGTPRTQGGTGIDTSLLRLIEGPMLGTGAGRRSPEPLSSLDFTRPDPLGLAFHPDVLGAGHGKPGTRTPATAIGAVETRLAAVTGLPMTRVFASGHQAIRQTLGALLRPGDDVLIDAASDPAMVETVIARHARPHRMLTCFAEAVERRLARLARQPRRGRLFVAVPALSRHGARAANLADLCTLTRQYGATLIADLSQDFASMGQDGGGLPESQTCLGRIDIVLGDLSASLGTPAGFAAFRDPALGAAIAPIAPPNAPTLEAAANLAFSAEGQTRRRNLHGLSLRLRNHLMADGLRVLGDPAPFVLVPLPAITALPRTALLESAGPRVTLVQGPTVPLTAPRWRIDLTAGHGPADIDDLADLIRDVSRAFNRAPVRHRVPV